jgi:hypothetical protein
VLQGFVLDQHHGQRLTQPLLLGPLRRPGIASSAGPVSNLLTPDQGPCHRDKAEVLPAGLPVSPYLGLDETGARQRGHNGPCWRLGNDLFAYVHSSDSKSRLNFLEALRQPHTDSVINEVAPADWADQQLSAAVTAALGGDGPAFADAALGPTPLTAAAVTSERHVRSATAGAFLGSLIEHGVSPEWVVLSDGASQ